jgi:hypothetical protein
MEVIGNNKMNKLESAWGIIFQKGRELSHKATADN